MPELPEVETAVKDLSKEIKGRKILKVWTDAPKILKFPKSFKLFQKEAKGKKIKDIRRKGKNILIDLSGNLTLLLHQKMTGHLMVGNWERKEGRWQAKNPGPLRDPVNRFLHLVFWLDDKRMLALSDLRKFAKVMLTAKDKIEALKELRLLGPDPLEKNFNYKQFKEVISKKSGKIKKVLMDQNVISGIGNIYSDEILWQSKIHPFRELKSIPEKNLRDIYKNIKIILTKAIKYKGDSVSDYRLITGALGGYQRIQKVYSREGKLCARKDSGIIKRVKMGARSAHFCPVCQK